MRPHGPLHSLNWSFLRYADSSIALSLTALKSCRELKESTASFKRAATNRIGCDQLPGICTSSCSCTHSTVENLVLPAAVQQLQPHPSQSKHACLHDSSAQSLHTPASGIHRIARACPAKQPFNSLPMLLKYIRVVGSSLNLVRCLWTGTPCHVARQDALQPHEHLRPALQCSVVTG